MHANITPPPLSHMWRGEGAGGTINKNLPTVYSTLSTVYQFHLQESSAQGVSHPPLLYLYIVNGVDSVPIHCPKINLNLSIKTEPVTVEADATAYVWFLYTRLTYIRYKKAKVHIWYKNQTYCIPLQLLLPCQRSVFMRRF